MNANHLAGRSSPPLPPEAARKLAELFPPGQLLTEPSDLIPYSYDGTAALRSMPAAVVLARSVGDVVNIVLAANEHRFPVVTRGSGTGLSGGSVPTPGSIVLSTVAMDRMLELDRRNLTALCECGVITADLAAAADRAGLFYPPDPGSMKISTIGGNVAENSGGLRGLKYGVTRDYVMGIEVVLADGTVAWLGSKCVKDVAGFSMRDVFIGSEGTLGVITKVLVKLIPRPAARRTLLAIFDDIEQAAATVSAIIEAPIIPCTLEFLDRTTIECVEAFAKAGLPTDAEAILLMETDGHPQAVADEAEAMARIAREQGARSVQLAADEEEATRLTAARRSAFSALARIAPTTILEDATVPRSELARMVAFIRKIATLHKLRIGTFGHMGDGNLHPTFLTDERDAWEMKRVEEAMREIFEFAVKLGGTITGEHGIGLAKKEYLPMAVGPGVIRLYHDLKRTLDPNGILNPGKIIDCPTDG